MEPHYHKTTDLEANITLWFKMIRDPKEANARADRNRAVYFATIDKYPALEQANDHLGKGKADLAARLAQEVLASHPEDWGANYIVGGALMSADPDKAITLLTKASTLTNHPYLLGLTKKALGDAYLNKGENPTLAESARLDAVSRASQLYGELGCELESRQLLSSIMNRGAAHHDCAMVLCPPPEELLAMTLRVASTRRPNPAELQALRERFERGYKEFRVSRTIYMHGVTFAKAMGHPDWTARFDSASTDIQKKVEIAEHLLSQFNDLH